MTRGQRPLHRATRAAATVAALFFSASASAQSVARYVAIVEQYAAGDESGSLARLAPDSGRLSSEIIGRMKALPDRDIRSAVMLHTELAAAWLASGQAPPAAAQIGNAERLLALLLDDSRRRAAAVTFGIRWYAFAANLYGAQGLFDSAFSFTREGLTRFPDAPELYVARGTVYEMRASTQDNGRFVNVFGEHIPVVVRRTLDAAAAEYQRALVIDGAFAAARLHRGWVHYRIGDTRASEDLELALRDARDDDMRYLAHLFLGAVAEHRNDLDAARRQFAAANALGPFQTSSVALSRIESALGHADRSRAVSAEYAESPDKREDPWWNYRLGGFTSDAVTWLRQEARRP